MSILSTLVDTVKAAPSTLGFPGSPNDGGDCKPTPQPECDDKSGRKDDNDHSRDDGYHSKGGQNGGDDNYKHAKNDDCGPGSNDHDKPGQSGHDQQGHEQHGKNDCDNSHPSNDGGDKGHPGDQLCKVDFASHDYSHGPDTADHPSNDLHGALASMSTDHALSYAIDHVGTADGSFDAHHFDAPSDTGHDTSHHVA